ncbi:MAG: YdcF family protein [Burkholderiales bacterium]|nr:YdcF family protein [Burkholderiales bacterium]
MNAWIQALGLGGLKPFLLALLLPPVPLLLLTLLGAWWLRRRPLSGWSLLLAGTALQWASWTPAGADALAQVLLQPPPALAHGERLAALPPGRGQALILVLGGGRTEAPEYGEVTLNALSLQRLRYGIRLSRQTGIALAFSGGRGPGMDEGESEGALAARIAREEYGQPLAWVEDRSRDTGENARLTVELLRKEGIGRLILVTHDLHEPRARRNFERARDAAGLAFELVMAPVGAPDRGAARTASDFLPSSRGIERSRYVLHEWLGRLAGA